MGKIRSIKQCGFIGMNVQPFKDLKEKMELFKVKYCPECKRAYEMESFNRKNYNDLRINYYNGFPTIGLEREVCITCDPKKVKPKKCKPRKSRAKNKPKEKK